MKRLILLATVLVLSPCLAQADSLTIMDQNASLKLNRNDPGTPLNVPNDPVQFPQTIEWTVDGRRILVYPSAPSGSLDIGHIHSDSHVAANQIHVEGPILGFGTSATAGTVVGGVVYTVNGGAPDSGKSTISEKVDIINRTNAAVSLPLAGLGWNPAEGASHQEGIEIPNLAGFNITGRTVAFFQGSAETGPSIIDPPFGPVTVLPGASFSGFNTFAQSFSLPAGATLTMITELNVAP